MPSIYDEMLCSILAERLDEEIELENEPGSVLCIAKGVLSQSDADELIKSAKKEARRLRRKANGCPSRIFEWRKHYGAE